MKRLTIMDLDSIVYIVAYKNRDERLPSIIIDATKDFVDTIIQKTEAEAYVGYYQVEGHKNYRNIYFPEYKSNRPDTPDFVRKWRPVIHEVFKGYAGIVGLTIIESDDALSIMHKKYKEKYFITLACIDKDLKCLPGRHYNYVKDTFSEVTVEEGRHLADVQCIAGDAGDGIPSIKGIGPAKAKKYLKENDTVIKAFRAAAKDKKVDSWIRLFNQTFSCINLLNSLEELKKYTSKEEVDIFHIDEMEYEEGLLSEIGDW